MLYTYLGLINILSLFCCYIDKKNAIKHKQRISEKKLLSLSILGGSLGFLLGMYTFHHKTQHLKFVILVPLCLLLWTYIIIKERGII